MNICEGCGKPTKNKYTCGNIKCLERHAYNRKTNSYITAQSILTTVNELILKIEASRKEINKMIIVSKIKILSQK